MICLIDHFMVANLPRRDRLMWRRGRDGPNEGAKPHSVENWKQRDRIPSEYWQRAIEVARARGNEICADDLASALLPRNPVPKLPQAFPPPSCGGEGRALYGGLAARPCSSTRGTAGDL